MKNRNIYKDIVEVAVFLAILYLLVQLGIFWHQEQRHYGFTISAKTAITEEDVKELGKLPGILEFEPSVFIPVKIELEGYTLETQLMGVNLKRYPLKWAKTGQKFFIGSTPALFFGENSFQGFTDSYGYSPSKSQMKKWINDYQEVSLQMTDEFGIIREAKISGILKNPEQQVCIDISQMKKILGRVPEVTSGYMEVQGARNKENAKNLLEGAGFLAEE